MDSKDKKIIETLMGMFKKCEENTGHKFSDIDVLIKPRLGEDGNIVAKLHYKDVMNRKNKRDNQCLKCNKNLNKKIRRRCKGCMHYCWCSEYCEATDVSMHEMECENWVLENIEEVD